MRTRRSERAFCVPYLTCDPSGETPRSRQLLVDEELGRRNTLPPVSAVRAPAAGFRGLPTGTRGTFLLAETGRDPYKTQLGELIQGGTRALPVPPG
jgi:hypothetical protein